MKALAGVWAALLVLVAGLAVGQGSASAAPIGRTVIACCSSAEASRIDWAHDFEGALGVPQGGNNDLVIQGWEIAEGGGTFTSPSYSNICAYNPINTTLPETGSTKCNDLGHGNGVQHFTSWAQGVNANVAAISVQTYGYPAIVADLAGEAAVATTAAAIGASSWCNPNTCYGGPGAPTIVADSGGVPTGTVLSAPTSGGNYAQCNAYTAYIAQSSTQGADVWDASCNYASGYTVTGATFQFSYQTATGSGAGSTCGYAASTTAWYGTTASSCSVLAVSPQRVQFANGGYSDCPSHPSGCSYSQWNDVLTGITVTVTGASGSQTVALSIEPSTWTTAGPALFPAYPLKYYSGGAAGSAFLPSPPLTTAGVTSSGGVISGTTVAEPTPGTPLCTRVMPETEASPVTFQGIIQRQSGVSYSYQWSFGDGATDTASATDFDTGHTYTAALPAGGWTAVMTVTATGDGVNYAGTVTSTCSLRVDFNNPDQSTAGTTGSGVGGDSNSCPTGWGWLNPDAVVKLLACLFIPSSATSNALSSLWTSVQNTEPFSFVVDVMGILPRSIAQMQEAMATYGSNPNPGFCLNQGVSESGYLGTGAAHITDPINVSQACLSATSSPGLAPPTGLGVGGGGNLWDALVFIRTVLLVGMTLGAAFAVWRWVSQTIEG